MSSAEKEEVGEGELAETDLQIVRREGEYIQSMMNSGIPDEITKLDEDERDFEDSWNDSSGYMEFLDEDLKGPQMSSTLDNIEGSMSSSDSSENSKSGPQQSQIPGIRIFPCDVKNSIHSKRHSQSLNIDILETIDEHQPLAKSPNVFFLKRKQNMSSDSFLAEDNGNHRESAKYKMKRPPDLEIAEFNTRGPANFSDDHSTDSSVLYSNTTPVEPCYSSPPTGTALDHEQTKMAILLKRFGLTHFIYTFLQQEVDLDLFLTLNDQDLQEIGIERKSDRIILLSVVAECNRYKM